MVNICPICKKQFSDTDKGTKDLKRHVLAKQDPFHKVLANKKRQYKLANFYVLYQENIEKIRELKKIYGEPKIFDDQDVIDIEDEGLM